MRLARFLKTTTNGQGNKDGEEMEKDIFFMQKQVQQPSVLSGRALKVAAGGRDRRSAFQPELLLFLCFVFPQ